MAIKIYVDQGHNPVAPNAGAEGNGVREQDITYRIGLDLAGLLRADGNFSVRLSRPTADTQLGNSTASSLNARVVDANEWGADYFISLHTNASTSAYANGTEGFAYSREIPAFRFGEAILEGVSRETCEVNRGMFARPGLYVLRKTTMPAVLIELGFITNREEAMRMQNEPDRYAKGVYRGIRSFTLSPQNTVGIPPYPVP